jgi:hypothetical protein
MQGMGYAKRGVELYGQLQCILISTIETVQVQ